MRVLILAGGVGSRLLPLTAYHPKIMTSVHGVPFIKYLMKLYRRYDVLLSLGHMRECVKEWLRDNDVLMECVDEYENLGHSGAILHAKPFLEGKKYFCVVNGDTYHNIDLDKAIHLFSWASWSTGWTFSAALSTQVFS